MTIHSVSLNTSLSIESFLSSEPFYFIYASDLVSSCTLLTWQWAKYKVDCSDGSESMKCLLSQKKKFIQNRNKQNHITLS